MKACYTHLLPHLGVIHTCIVAYSTSSLSTPSQKTPPPPLKSVEATHLAKLNRDLWKALLEQLKDYPWSQNVPANYLAYSMTLHSINLAKKEPSLLNAEECPAGIDWLTCGTGSVKGSKEDEGLLEGRFRNLDIKLALEPEANLLPFDGHSVESLSTAVLVSRRAVDFLFLLSLTRTKLADVSSSFFCISSDHQAHDWKFGSHKPMCQKFLWDE